MTIPNTMEINSELGSNDCTVQEAVDVQVEVNWVITAAQEKTHRAEVVKVTQEEHQKEKLQLTKEKAKWEQVVGMETEWEKAALRPEAMWMNQEVSMELISKVQD